MGYEPEHPALREARRVCEAYAGRLQQFGQPNSYTAWSGGTACTHVICQLVKLLYHDRLLTIDRISAMAGYPTRARNSAGQPRGMNSTELARFFAEAGLPYVIRFRESFPELHQHTTKGPVMLAVRHGSIPEKRGYVYFGTRADGRPNGFARVSGRTQLTGFEDGAHAVADLGSRRYYSTSRTVTVTCDTIVRRSPSLEGEKLGHVGSGSTATATGTEQGGHWSGCGKEGTSWRRVTAINGRSTLALYGRAYAYIAAGLTTSPASTLVRTDVWSKDPNHNSSSRPENPAYDVISKTQAAIMYNDHTNRLGRLPYGAIPTRSFL